MDGNLLEKANIGFELDSSISKIIILALIGFILAFFFGFFLKLFILVSQPNFLLFSFLAAIGFLAVYLLNILFIKTLWLNNLTAFLGILAFLVPFYDGLSKIILLVGLISFLFLVWGIYSGRKQIQDSLKIKFWELSKKSIPKAITGLALITAVICIANFSLAENNFFISKPTFEKTISSLFNFDLVQNFLPGFDLSLSVDSLIRNIAINQIEGNSELKTLSFNAKDELINQTTKGLENEISGFTDVPLDPNIKASEALYGIMVRKISQLQENNRSLILVIIAALIFLIIISLTWVIRFLATIPAYITYEICLALGFSTIMLEDKSREVVVLK